MIVFTRSLIALSPIGFLACIYIAFGMACWHLGKIPDANTYSVMKVAGGLFYWLSLMFLLTMLLAIPLGIRWGRRDRQWKWLGMFVCGLALSVALLAVDPLHAREWFLY